MLENAVHEFLIRLGMFVFALLTIIIAYNVCMLTFRILTMRKALNTAYRQEIVGSEEHRASIKARVNEQMKPLINKAAFNVLIVIMCTAVAVTCKLLFDISW
jgi:hypothetical protein